MSGWVEERERVRKSENRDHKTDREGPREETGKRDDERETQYR